MGPLCSTRACKPVRFLNDNYGIVTKIMLKNLSYCNVHTKKFALETEKTTIYSFPISTKIFHTVMYIFVSDLNKNLSDCNVRAKKIALETERTKLRQGVVK